MDLAEQSPTSSAADVNKLSCAIHPIPRVCNNNYRARLTTLTKRQRWSKASSIRYDYRMNDPRPRVRMMSFFHLDLTASLNTEFGREDVVTTAGLY
jgi:hypothetical protein